MVLLPAGTPFRWMRQREGGDSLPGESCCGSFSVAEDSFVQTRADLIGKDGTGPQYGTIYIRQTPKEDQNTHMWGHYRVTEGQSGSLTLEDKEHLYWLDSETEYFFEAISVPVNGNDIERSGGVTFTDEMPYESGGQGEVTFGGYDTGLEYFVGVTVGPQKLSNGQTVTMSMARQIGKIIFKTIKYKNASDVENENVEECRIIFPNLPTKATFDLDRMYRVNQVTMDPQPLGMNGRNYLCLTDSDEKGIKMTWKKALYPKPTHLTEDEHNSKTQAIYLPTFMFWDGKDNKPENQSGFFIIQYKDRTYTGNLNVKTLGTNDYIRLWPGDCLRVIVTLQDGSGRRWRRRLCHSRVEYCSRTGGTPLPSAGYLYGRGCTRVVRCPAIGEGHSGTFL